MDLRWLSGLSPLLTIQKPGAHPSDKLVSYPPIMLLTSADDKLVSPVHSLKLVAELQKWHPSNRNSTYE
jgi:prolyl oligopeptidase PreP (S9A serine peptidase family)